MNIGISLFHKLILDDGLDELERNMMMMTGMRILGWSDGVVQGEPAFLLHRKAKAQFNSLEKERK
jgi:hypothetical protein